MRTTRRPSAGWYWVAAVVAVGGLVAAVAWGVWSYGQLSEQVTEFARTSVPGAVTVTVDEPGELTVYYEAPRVAGEEFVPPLDVSVTDPAGVALPSAAYKGDIRLDIPDHVAIAVSTFEASADGTYVVTVDGEADAGAAVSVGRLPTIGAQVLGALLLLIVSVVVALVIVTAVAVLRGRPAPVRTTEAREPASVG
jgi:hypothetical protein